MCLCLYFVDWIYIEGYKPIPVLAKTLSESFLNTSKISQSLSKIRYSNVLSAVMQSAPIAVWNGKPELRKTILQILLKRTETNKCNRKDSCTAAQCPSNATFWWWWATRPHEHTKQWTTPWTNVPNGGFCLRLWFHGQRWKRVPHYQISYSLKEKPAKLGPSCPDTKPHQLKQKDACRYST